MSVSQDLGQREIWTLGSVSAQLSRVSTSGKGRKRVCSPVIEEGVWFQVSCAGGFLVRLPFLMVFRVQEVGGPLVPGIRVVREPWGTFSPRDLEHDTGLGSVVKPSVDASVSSLTRWSGDSKCYGNIKQDTGLGVLKGRWGWCLLFT